MSYYEREREEWFLVLIIQGTYRVSKQMLGFRNEFLSFLFVSDILLRKRRKRKMYEDIFIYVLSKRQIVKIAEGSGDNLDGGDYANGYVDYIYYEQYAIEDGFPDVLSGNSSI